MSKKPNKKQVAEIVILGRNKDAGNYLRALEQLKIPASCSLSLPADTSCIGLIFPGGGDITPAFFGQKNTGSHHIDTELDILQLQAMEYAVNTKLPILGICKGMQLINVFFGGTILQHMPQAQSHAYQEGDQLHQTSIAFHSFLFPLYGAEMQVNSAHHQCVHQLGKGLRLVQWAHDHTPEALCHESLPIWGVQWHPERLALTCGENGAVLLSAFYDSIAAVAPSPVAPENE